MKYQHHYYLLYVCLIRDHHEAYSEMTAAKTAHKSGRLLLWKKKWISTRYFHPVIIPCSCRMQPGMRSGLYVTMQSHRLSKRQFNNRNKGVRNKGCPEKRYGRDRYGHQHRDAESRWIWLCPRWDKENKGSLRITYLQEVSLPLKMQKGFCSLVLPVSGQAGW